MNQYMELNEQQLSEVEGGGLLGAIAGGVLGGSIGFLTGAAIVIGNGIIYGPNSYSGAEARNIIKATTMGGAGIGVSAGLVPIIP